MIKIITMAIVMTSLCFVSTAQKKISTYFSGHFGVASANSSSGGNTSKLSTGIGAEFAFPLAKKIWINARPTLNFRGYNNSSFELKASYIDLPINLELDYFNVEDFSLYAGAGIYAGLAIGGKYMNTGADWVKLKFGEGSQDNRSATDFGLNFTTGLKFRKIKMGFQDQIGLKNVVPKDRQTAGASIKLRNFSGFIAVQLSAFRGKRK